MQLARGRFPAHDGDDVRILARAAPRDPWSDVRRAERLRLERRGATRASAAHLAAAIAPSSMAAALANGDAFLDAARGACACDDARLDAEPVLLNALDPSAYRDFMAFDGHFSFGYRWLGRPVPEVLYELPVSYFGNAAAFLGPDDEVPWPHYTEHLDYELEIGIVIGRAGASLTPESALDHIVGLTILNDFSARDIQLREMSGGLGPSKAKHFASAGGPWITTLDALPSGGLRMQARVNGETWCDADSGEMIWSLEEIVAWASQGEALSPGMLLGSGTCNGGCTIEVQKRLAPGDLIEFEIEGLGVLRNRLGQPAANGWWPEPRTPPAADADAPG